MQAEVETITPTMAHELLGQNTHNRNVRPSLVTKYAGAIKRGEWKITGQAIQIDTKGRLLDGQHRLLAVVEAKKSIKALVVRGLPSSAQETIDTGRMRNLADILQLRGEKSSTVLAGAMRLLYGYEGDRTFHRTFRVQPTPQELLAVLERHPGLRDAVTDGRQYRRQGAAINPALLSTLYYLFSEVHKEDAETFFERFSTGLELTGKTDPIYVLRRLLDKNRDKPSRAKVFDARYVAAVTIKAFNAWRAGDEIDQLRYQGGGARPDKYPEIQA